jgi:hypothetical protein
VAEGRPARLPAERVSLDLHLRNANPRGKLDGVVYTVHLQRLAAGWRVDDFSPQALFYRNHTMYSFEDTKQQAADARREGEPSSGGGFALIGGIAGAVVGVPLLVFGTLWLRDRRARRRYRAAG